MATKPWPDESVVAANNRHNQPPTETPAGHADPLPSTRFSLSWARGAKTSTRPRIRQLSPRGSRPRCEEGRKIKEGRREGVADRKLRSWQQWEESPSTRGRQGGQIFTPARVAKLEGNRFEMTFHLTGHKRWRRVQGRKTRSHPLRGQCAPTISIQRKRETWLRG